MKKLATIIMVAALATAMFIPVSAGSPTGGSGSGSGSSGSGSSSKTTITTVAPATNTAADDLVKAPKTGEF